MATKRKVKRYADEGYVYEDDTPEEVANRSESAQSIMDEAKGDAMLKAMRDEASKPAPKAAAKSVAKPVSKPTATPAPAAKPAATSTPASTTAKKETYKDFSGNVRIKKSDAERDAEMAARRSSVMSGLRNIGSSISDAVSRARQNYESTRPVSRQTQRERDQAAARGNLAKGGTARSASSRADGIAKRGKTRGKLY